MLGIFALGIPASSALIVRSPSSRHRLHQLATDAIRDELGLRATIGRVQLQLVPLSLVGQDITLDDPIYGQIAEADVLRIEPSWRALLRGGLDIDAITIERATLRLVIRNGQVRNLPRAEGGGGGGPPDLPFDALHVLDSTLTIDAEPHASGQIRDVDLHLTDLEGGIRVETRAGGGWVRHAGGRETLTELDGQVEVYEDSLRIPRLTLETPDLRVAVRDGSAAMPFEDHGYAGHVELRYDLAHLERLPLPEGTTLPPIVGVLELDLELASDGETQSADGTVDLEGGRIEQFGLGQRAHLLVHADRSRVDILEGSVAENMHDGGLVHITGNIGLDPAEGFPLDVRARVEDLSFARLMSDLDVTDNGIVEWMFDGTLDLRGTLDPIRLEGPVRLRTHDFRVTKDPYHAPRIRRVIGVDRADFTGRWSIRDDAVRFHNLVGELAHSRLHGDVLLGYDNRLAVRAVLDTVDLQDVSPLDRWPVAGTGTATIDISNTFQDPLVVGHVEMADFVFDTFRLGNLTSDALLDPDGMGVHFAMVQAEKNDSRYRAENLYLDFHDDRFAMSGALHLDGMQLADFYEVFGFEEDERFAPYQGLARGTAQLRYTNGFPHDSESGTLDVDMELGLDWTELDGYRFEDGRFAGHWRWLDWDRGAAGGELAVRYLSLHKGEGTVALDGTMALGGVLDMDVVADRVALSQLEGIGDRFAGIDGVASVIGRVGGTFDVMHADFDLGVTNVTYDGQPLGDGRFFVRLTDRDDPYVLAARDWTGERVPEDEPCARARHGLATASWPRDPPLQTRDGPQVRLDRPMAYLICGSGLDDRLRVDLAMGRTTALPVRGSLSLDGLELASFVPDGVDNVDGRVSGELAFTDGAIRSPETLRGSVRLSEVHVGLDDLEVENRRPVLLSFHDGVLSVDKARFIGPDSRLRLRGHASLEDGYALSVNGDVDLALLSRLTPSVEDASGHIEARFNVSGPLDDPELFGEATVENGAFQLAALGAPITGLGGRIRFSQRSVLFEDFEAEVAGGQLAVSGGAEMRDRGLQRYAFNIDARGLNYTFADGVEAGFGVQTQLVWEQGERLPRLDGELRVNRFAYTRPIELRSLGDVAGNAVRGMFRRTRTEVRRYDPDEDSVAVDLRVIQRGPFRIQNNLLTADVRIDSDDGGFRIVGTDQRYGVDGAMQISNGNIFFQNNEFDVRRGSIAFNDPTRIDPRIDIEATTEIRRTSDLSSINWRVLLRLTGSSDNLQLTTESDPDLPQPDILMLLAFGMTRAELQQLQVGDVGSVAALEALSSATGLDRALQEALPLIDDVRLTTGYSQRTGRTEPRLSVGKRLAERVRLSATTGLGEGREFRGALEWQLDDNMRLGASYDNYNIDPANSFGNLGVDWGYRLEFE
ncbi:MAG: translocation/assembly module TamB domain-containing protein [Sandaracinaceae bacterium]